VDIADTSEDKGWIDMVRVVMIECPHTGKPTATGVVMSQEEFDAATPTNVLSGCGECGGNHSWSKEDGFLADEESE